MFQVSDLLSTKLALPRLRTTLVRREALFARLDNSWEYPLTLLSAPAGFGKTTLVRSWAASRKDEQGCFLLAWLSLDAGDNDPVRFWRYLIAACQQFDADIGQAALERLNASQSPGLEMSSQLPFEPLLKALINDLSKISSHCVLIMEDYDAITLPQIHKMMAFFLEHLPTAIHCVLLSRSDPPLPLARLRARGEQLELRATDLQFSLDETRHFLQQTLPFPLTEGEIALLHERTEGGGAGLNLVASALHRYADPGERARFLGTLTGRYRPLLEYLVSDVLNAQPEPLQEFLLQTSGLGRLTGALCDMVTGRHDSDLLLEQIERANLFLEPLDGTGQWYRYHALFAEAMQLEAQRRLGKEAIQVCFRRASSWHEQHNRLPDAVEAALQAEDFARTTTLVERVVGSIHVMGINEFYTLRRWLGQVPQSILQQHPALCFVYASTLFFEPDGRILTDIARCKQIETLLHIAEQYWSSEGNTARLAEVNGLRALLATWQGDHSRAGRFAAQALPFLPEKEVLWRGMCLGIMGAEERIAGSLDKALPMVQEALALCQQADNIYSTRATRLELAEIYHCQGKLHQAYEEYCQVLADAGEDLLDRARAQLGRAQLFYEWHMLDASSQAAQEALALGEHIEDRGLQVHSALVLARVLYARGDRAQAQQKLVRLVTLAQASSYPLLARELLFWQARLQFANGDFSAVQRWINLTAFANEAVPLFLAVREELLIACWQLVHDKVDDALHLLERCLTRAHHHAHTACALEVQVLLALAYFKLNNLEMARQALQEVLPQLHTEGYRRVFLDEGPMMAACLRTVVASSASAGETYLSEILALFKGTQPEHLPEQPSLIEPLSSQEQRVLRLFVAGLSKPEIARELVISINTVKTHLQRIYRKLHVTSRAEARTAARHLHLFQNN